MPSEAQVNFFLFHSKFMFCSQDIQVFLFYNYTMIYQIFDVMISISIWGRLHFWVYCLNYNSLTLQTWSIDRYKQGEYFSEILWTIWRTGANFQAFFNLATCSNYSVTSYVKFLVFHYFERVNKGESNVVNMNY